MIGFTSESPGSVGMIGVRKAVASGLWLVARERSEKSNAKTRRRPRFAENEAGAVDMEGSLGVAMIGAGGGGGVWGRFG